MNNLTADEIMEPLATRPIETDLRIIADLAEMADDALGRGDEKMLTVRLNIAAIRDLVNRRLKQ